MEMLTSEEVAQHYAAMLDSVRVIETLEAAGASDEDALEAVARNKAYLKVMLGRNAWADLDMARVEAALG